MGYIGEQPEKDRGVEFLRVVGFIGEWGQGFLGCTPKVVPRNGFPKMALV